MLNKIWLIDAKYSMSKMPPATNIYESNMIAYQFHHDYYFTPAAAGILLLLLRRYIIIWLSLPFIKSFESTAVK